MTRSRVRATRTSILLSVSLLLAACGGGGDTKSVDTTATTTAGTTETTAATESSAAGAISDKQDVVKATVRIVASGSFRDISEGQQAADWSGSGFIISSDGLVVTNQHVVEGAGSLEVYVDGQESPVNAKILGVSECNDLAVIDLEGDGYSFVNWYDGDSSPGVDVWTAGFPLGDPEFTLARGSITKAKANGETDWASIDYSLEHDARQEPGNSGGPLVDEKGQVVGVNYSGGDVGGTGVEHFYSIPTALAKPIVEVLETGKDYDSVGINGRAFFDSESGIAGLWVSGVRAGSPASNLNIKPGDIVTDLAGRQIITQADLDRDGYATKKGYCDVLRTQGTDKAISIRVLRFDTNEILSGELNNTARPLELEASIANEATGDSDTASSDLGGYTGIVDDSGSLYVDVPTAWSDVDTSGLPAGDQTLPGVLASPSLEAFFSGYSVPGIVVALAPDGSTATIDETIDSILPSDCTRGDRTDYQTDYLSGKFEVLSNCGGTAVAAVAGAFIDAASGRLVVILSAALQDSDFAAVDQALFSLYIDV